MSGKTDPSIALEIMAFAGLDEKDAGRHLAPVLDRLETELAAAAPSIRMNGRVLPGVRRVLAGLHGRAGVIQTVLTGNTARNAAVKLRAFGLEQWLDLRVAAFGSDRHDREELVPLAVERARRVRGLSFRPQEVWVVGDTPRDLACARAAGANCLLVATGRSSRAQLQEAGGDHVMGDLTDTERVCALLFGP